MIFEDRIPETVSPRTKLIAGAVLALALALAVAGWFFGWFGKGSDTAAAPSGPPPANVAIDYAQNMVMSPHTVLPGTVVSVRDAVIASETSGKVLSVAFVGDVISVEDSIAEIDPQNAQQMVEQRRAELQRLESLYQYHSDYYKRVGVEENKLGIPEIGIAELKSNVETAKADVSRAKAALRSAENDLNRTSIKAPFPGRVVS